MIKRLHISNFQSHKDTAIEFSPGVNVLIGSSDSGKSAIIRAIRWAIWNRPLGDSFRSWWGGDTSVMVETDDYQVVRFKGTGGDHYSLTGKDGKRIEFKAFGTTTPEEIEHALNLSDLNLQSQMDNSFLISNNPGEVSRHFNKIANIDKIDSALKAVESWVRGINQNVKATEVEIERFRTDLKSFEYLDKLEAEVESLEQSEIRLASFLNKGSQLAALMGKVEMVEDLLGAYTDILSVETLVDRILDLFEKKSQKKEQYTDLKTLCLHIVECQKQIKEYNHLIDDESIVNTILELYNKESKQLQLAASLDALLIQETNTDTEILRMEGILEDLETKWHDNVPDICPLCDQKIL